MNMQDAFRLAADHGVAVATQSDRTRWWSGVVTWVRWDAEMQVVMLHGNVETKDSDMAMTVAHEVAHVLESRERGTIDIDDHGLGLNVESLDREDRVREIQLQICAAQNH